ncbi:MAG: InlB B-repeat-containing protein [Ruminococcus sp.]|nr:InlB B-repeat-containing protein [Ruminococcus sp.]
MKRTLMCIASLVLCLLLLIPANIVTADAADDFYDTATMVAIRNHIEKDGKFGNHVTVQGACTDQKYAYIAVNNGYTTILKYDVNTWELKKKSEPLALDHANDMTYNPNSDLLVVANNSPNFDTISFVDPETLTIVKTQKIKYKIYSISYNSKYNKYVCGLSGGYDFIILDNKFKKIEKYEGYKSGLLRQGCDCDDDYLYFVQSGSGGNLIVIYDWSGKLVDTVSVNKSYEVENIFHVGKTFFTTLHYYGNYIYRLGLNDSTAIKFTIKYDKNGGSGSMENQTVTYGKEQKLTKCAFEKENYFFGGWIMTRNSYKTTSGKKTPYSKTEWLSSKDLYEYSLYADNSKVSKTTNLGNITAKAFWIAEKYTVNYDNNGGEGELPPRTVGYDEIFKIDTHNMTRQGYIFTGWTAIRDFDNKVYGFQKDQTTPSWLKEKDVETPYVFSDSQEVSKLTYDGAVTFRAHWQLAFNFSNDATELLSYVGTDENVVFPAEFDKVSKIAEEAFKDNQTMCCVTIPATIDTVGKNAFLGCDALREIHFDHSLPKNVERSAFDSSLLKRCYLKNEKEEIFIGMYASDISYNFLVNICDLFFL